MGENGLLRGLGVNLVQFMIICDLDDLGCAKGLSFPHQVKLPKAITLRSARVTDVSRRAFTSNIDLNAEERAFKGWRHLKRHQPN
jgi:hypothetical protein